MDGPFKGGLLAVLNALEADFVSALPHGVEGRTKDFQGDPISSVRSQKKGDVGVREEVVQGRKCVF